MRLLALFLILLSASACATPRRVVIEDKPEFSSVVIDSVDNFEELLGCRIWKNVTVGGRDKDWKGKRPPFGTITIEHEDQQDKAGYAHMSVGGRTRITLLREKPRHVVVIHELLHAMDFGHDETGIMKGKNPPPLAKALSESPPKTLRKLKRLCLPAT